MADINWQLIEELATKPHKHLRIADDVTYGVMMADGTFDTGNGGVGEVMQEARSVQHLCDLAGIPEGKGDSAHVDARTYLCLVDVLALRERLDRIAGWHSRETGPGGMVGDYCAECASKTPCDTRQMADGTYQDDAEAPVEDGESEAQ